MSLKSQIEAVIYASEEPVTLQQLVGLLAGEAAGELDAIAAGQAQLPLADAGEQVRGSVEAGDHEPHDGSGASPLSPENIAVSGGEISGADAAPDSESEPLQENEEAPASTEAPLSADTEEERRRRERAIRDHVRRVCDQLIREYAESDRGIEVREVASGFRMGTKPEYHDAVRGFVKSLKPPLRLTLQALETLAVVAYKQPVTAAEISEIRGVDSSGVLGGLMTRKLIATAGRKQVIGRPMLYKTTRDFLLRFGLKDISELPSMDEFERMAGELAEQEDLPLEDTGIIIEKANTRGDAEMIRDANAESGDAETNMEEEQEQATAEIAEGGNHEQAGEESAGQGTAGTNESPDEEHSEAEEGTNP